MDLEMEQGTGNQYPLIISQDTVHFLHCRKYVEDMLKSIHAEDGRCGALLNRESFLHVFDFVHTGPGLHVASDVFFPGEKGPEIGKAFLSGYLKGTKFIYGAVRDQFRKCLHKKLHMILHCRLSPTDRYGNEAIGDYVRFSTESHRCGVITGYVLFAI